MISRLVSIAIQIKAAKGMLANCKSSQYNWSRLSPSARAVHRKKEETWVAIVETLEGAEASEARTADLLKALTDAALEFERRMDEHADSYNKHDFGDGQWLAYRNAAAWIHDASDASDAITGEGKQWAAAKGGTV